MISATQPASYDADSIQVLHGLDAVRKRPGMYIGDVTDPRGGLLKMALEVIDNAVDEASAGYAKEITTVIHADGSLSVTDDGRGIPVDIMKEEGLPAVEVIMTQLHAGGKFDNASYKTSGGLHGVGVSVVNGLSKWLQVTVWRDSSEYEITFENGFTTSPLRKVSDGCDKCGTRVTFLPSVETFSSIEFDFDALEAKVHELAFLNSGVRFILLDERTGKNVNYCFNGGIEEFALWLDRAKRVISGKTIMIAGEDSETVVEVGMHWNDSYHENIVCFTNNIRQRDGGSHLAGFRSALTKSFNKYLAEYCSDELKKLKISIVAEDIREGLTAVLAVKTMNPAFASQTKDQLITPEVRFAVERTVSRDLSRWLEENRSSARLIVEKVMTAAKAREAAKKARELSRKKTGPELLSVPHKLANCQSKDPAKCELFLVEGDSAGGTAKQGRDRAFQAILSLRGKILNTERARLDKVFGFAEIAVLIGVLGTGIGDNFDLSKLRYHKIVIMTDADVDGAHIRTLLITFFYRYMPTLVEAGHLYIAQPPLYKVRRGSTEMYIKDARELYKYLSKLVIGDLDVVIGGVSLSTEDKAEFIDAVLSFNQELKSFSNQSLLEVHEALICRLVDSNPSDIHLSAAAIDVILSDLLHSLNINANTNEVSPNDNSQIESSENRTIDVDSAGATNDNFADICYNIVFDYNERTFIITKKIDGLEFRDVINVDGLCHRLTPALCKAIQYIMNVMTHSPTFIFKKRKYTFTNSVSLFAFLFEQAKKSTYIQRFKGLGEMNPGQLWETTLDPANRRLSLITLEGCENPDLVFSTLMGDEVAARREFIEENALKLHSGIDV